MRRNPVPKLTVPRDDATIPREAQRGPSFVTRHAQSQFDTPVPSLLDLMHGLAGGGDEPFEPGHLSGEVQAARFD